MHSADAPSLEGIDHSSDIRVFVLGRGNCVVVGDCFPDVLDTSDICHDPVQKVKALAGQHWGRFVVIAYSSCTRSLVIYRDPSGMVPCYYTIYQDYVMLSSANPKSPRSSAGRLSLNWNAIAHHLMFPHLPQRQTCLDGICEVLPGELVIIRDEAAHHELIWKPSHYVGDNRSCNVSEARDKLGAVLKDTLETWCSRYPYPLISASGGFDSSTVASLARSFGSIKLINFYTESLRGDERAYASTLADYLGEDLNTAICRADDVELQKNLSAFRPCPSARTFTQTFDKAARAYADAVNASAHFSGGGGDNVFGKLHSAYPLADLFKQKGFCKDLWPTLLDICHVTGAPLTGALRQFVGSLTGVRSPSSWTMHPELLRADIVSSISENPHPWVTDVASEAPGKRQLVRNIARATALTGYLNILDDRPTVYPLLSQPIIELSLSFPTWLWVAGGADRAIARMAMRSSLPAQILDRKGKGAFDGLVYQILSQNWDQIFDDLEGGLLADHGLLAIEEMRAIRRNRLEAKFMSNILHIHETEVWCRSWA